MEFVHNLRLEGVKHIFIITPDGRAYAPFANTLKDGDAKPVGSDQFNAKLAEHTDKPTYVNKFIHDEPPGY